MSAILSDTMTRPLNIVIGGEAGQGLVTLGNLLAKSLVRGGYWVVVTQSYQSRIRGGHNTFAVRVSDTEIAAPQEPIDFLVALDAETVVLHKAELSDHGIVIGDPTMDIQDDAVSILGPPFRELGSKRAGNIIALGIVSSLIGLSEDVVSRTLGDFFGKQDPELIRENRQAFEKAFAWALEKASPIKKLPPMGDDLPRRMMMNGNEAIAMGALSAGLRFCSFYPMTPATSLNLALVSHARHMGVIVEQAEDEIAAINMAVGASFAGAPSMAATSGGGFALMTEAVSLAGQTETPIVVIVAQRPGPATGLPTRTEQGDLEFVLHAGHGEFPRAIFAPGTVEECFYLSRKAFELAEKYQSPVFVLTDQFLADSYRAVVPFDVEDLAPVRPGADLSEASLPYRRFALTENGVSPRLIPGATEHLVVADSDEHTEDGRLTEDLAVRRQMVDKRLRKHEGLRADTVAPDWAGDAGPEILFVSWGSTKGSVSEAASTLRLRGKRVATLHFSQVWPLVPEHFLRYLEDAERVVSVEGNALGQFARLIRRETGFEIRSQVRRYDGLPMTPEYILEALDGQET